MQSGFDKKLCIRHRDGAMLHVIEYFAKSLTVTQVNRNDTFE